MGGCGNEEGAGRMFGGMSDGGAVGEGEGLASEAAVLVCAACWLVLPGWEVCANAFATKKSAETAPIRKRNFIFIEKGNRSG